MIFIFVDRYSAPGIPQDEHIRQRIMDLEGEKFVCGFKKNGWLTDSSLYPLMTYSKYISITHSS